MRFGGEEEEGVGVGVSLWAAAAAAAGPGNRSGGLEEVSFGESPASPSPSSPSWGSNVSTSYDRFGRNESLAKVEVAVLAVTLALAVSGNAAVLWSLGRRGQRGRRRRRKQPSRMHRFMLHLSLADLSVAFFQVLPQLCWEATHRFHGPDGLCRLVKHLQVFGMFASAYLLVAMTADRYVAVCHPLRALRQPPRRPGCMIAGAWGLSLLLSTPQYFIFSLSEVERGSQVYDCWAHFVMPWGPRAYITWVTGSVFVGPVLVLATCYGLICSRLWSNARDKGQGQRGEGGVEDGTKRRMLRMQRRMQAGSTPPPSPSPPPPPGGALRRQGMLLASPWVSSVKGISRAKIRTVKMTLVIVSAYIVCWAPFFTVQMRSVWEEQAAWVESEDILITVTALLASLNSCCNPWIYMFFSGHLLQDFLQSFLCCRKMKQRLNKEDSESISRRQTSFTNNRSPTNSVDTWRESQHFSQSIKFIPTSS